MRSSRMIMTMANDAVNGRKNGKSVFLSIMKPRISLDVDLLQSMNGGEIRLWMLLREMSRGRQVVVPDQRHLASLLDTTQSTISRRFKTLRALRVIALLPDKSKNIRERQNFLVFDQPANLDTILSIDASYLVFLQETSRNGSKKLRQLCLEELHALPQDEYQIYLELPVSKVEEILAREGSILEINEISLCTDESREENRESPLCTDESREENRESPLCTDESRGENRESPLCTDESRGYIYNHARAPTHRGIKTYGFNDNHTPILDGGSGGKDGIESFAFFQKPEFVTLTDRLASMYGKSTAHAVLNFLKLGRYSHKGKEFFYTLNEDNAAVILVSMIDRTTPVVSPLGFSTTLIHQAFEGRLCFLGNQYVRFLEISGKKDPQDGLGAGECTRDDSHCSTLPPLPDGTRLLGLSGNEYYIHNGILRQEGQEFGVCAANKMDGVGIYVLGFEEIHERIAAGQLTVIKDGAV